MIRLAFIVIFVAAAISSSTIPTYTWSCSDSTACGKILTNMVQASLNHSAPGMSCAAATANKNFKKDPSQQRKKFGIPKPAALGSSFEFVGSVGRYTYDEWEAHTTNATLFDMASCSKIMGTTTAVAQLYQRGLLDLDMKVADPTLLGPRFAAQGKGSISIRNLMLHNAGFPPDPNPGYSSPMFPCPQNSRYYPAQTFDCEEIIFSNLLDNQTLVYPTGSQYIYSDLSMITAMFVVGKIVQTHQLVPVHKFPPTCFNRADSLICNFYAYVAVHIFQRYGLTNTKYIPSDTINQCAPQWRDPWYHHGLIMGFVSDQNAFALGGVAGHAGVFSTVGDALSFMRVWMNVEDPEYLNETTIRLFTTVANLTQSSRALGWDTNYDTAKWCGTLSNATFFHIGYTGTQFCGDPVNGVITVLLGNGRYPDYRNDGTIWYRPEYNSLVKDLLT